MNICIEEIKKHLEQHDFKDFYKSRFFKRIVKIIKYINYNYGNKYFTARFDNFIFNKKTIHKYEKQLITTLDYIYDNTFKNKEDSKSFFVCKKLFEKKYYLTIDNQFCINGYDYINTKLKAFIK